jgi:beta-glucosidase
VNRTPGGFKIITITVHELPDATAGFCKHLQCQFITCYLPPYRAAVEAGALSVMSSFNDLNGTPATANSFLLQQILRTEWGFKGFVTTDYTGINEMVKHGTAADEREAGRQALSAGMDMDMQGGVYWDCLQGLVAKGELLSSQIDTAAKRVLTLKYLLGLFDDPYGSCNSQREKALCYAPEHVQSAWGIEPGAFEVFVGPNSQAL